MKVDTMLYGRVTCLMLGCLLSACNASNKHEAVKTSAGHEHKKEGVVINNEAAKDIQITVVKAPPAGAPCPQVGQVVTVHYTGYLMDSNGNKGSKFDSSHDRNDPLQFPVGVGYVIKGWDKGLLQMAKGGKYDLSIPSEMGYGARGAGAKIPPHSALIFEIEVLGIQNA